MRNRSKLTQIELANKVGVKKSTIAAYENDSRQPSYEILIKLATVFKVSIYCLLLDSSDKSINVSGLSSEQIDILKQIIQYFRIVEIIENIEENKLLDHNGIIRKYPESLNKK